MADRVKFISYNGRYPHLCTGTLVIEIDGEVYNLYNSLSSGGGVSFTADWDEIVTSGAWSVDGLPVEIEHLRKEIEDVVNKNVRWGCCGGCV